VNGRAREREVADRVPDMAKIVAFRSQLIHGYAVFNHDTVCKSRLLDAALHEALAPAREAAA
jgi:hypothetical protein